MKKLSFVSLFCTMAMFAACNDDSVSSVNDPNKCGYSAAAHVSIPKPPKNSVVLMKIAKTSTNAPHSRHVRWADASIVWSSSTTRSSNMP